MPNVNVLTGILLTALQIPVLPTVHCQGTNEDVDTLKVMQIKNDADTHTSMYVHDRGMAQFKCNYTGSNAIPAWIIDDVVYNWRDLPKNHHYYLRNSTLVIKEVDSSLNNTEYQCMLSPVLKSNIVRLLCIMEGPTSSQKRVSPSVIYLYFVMVVTGFIISFLET